MEMEAPPIRSSCPIEGISPAWSTWASISNPGRPFACQRLACLRGDVADWQRVLTQVLDNGDRRGSALALWTSGGGGTTVTRRASILRTATRRYQECVTRFDRNSGRGRPSQRMLRTLPPPQVSRAGPPWFPP